MTDRAPDPLARAAHTRQIGRRMIAIAILTMLALSQPVFALVDLAVPGWLPVWIMLVWLVAIASVAISVELRPDFAEAHREAEKPEP